MGVQVQITLYARNEAQAERAARAAFARFAALEDVMSDYRPTSELMRLCEKAGGSPVPVSADLFTVLSRAQAVARQSSGAFDVTIGPLVSLWRTARRTGVLPRLSALREAQARVGWQKMKLDAKNRTAQLLVPGMKLDLGGIAKGYAGDEAQKELKENGVTSAMVEAGGDIVASGPPPGRKGWEIQVEGTKTRVTLVNGAVSTSGDTEQFAEIGGRRYSHIVDPKTGLGLTHRLAVTIAAPDGLTSDSLSTAVSVLGHPVGREFVKRHYPNVSASFRFPKEQQKIR